jgi:hypothetical protein
MHPGIGATRALWQDSFAGYTSNSKGKDTLNRGCFRLNLPPGIVGAVVGQKQFEISHGLFGVFPAPIIIQRVCKSLQSFTRPGGMTAQVLTLVSDILFHSLGSFTQGEVCAVTPAPKTGLIRQIQNEPGAVGLRTIG